MKEIEDLLKLPKCVHASYIKATCPKAFAKCVAFFSDELNGYYLNDLGPGGGFGFWESKNYGCAVNRLWTDRNLYDFFDVYDVLIIIKYAGHEQWHYSDEYGVVPDDHKYYESRRDAETAAFIHAFIELEKLL